MKKEHKEPENNSKESNRGTKHHRGRSPEKKPCSPEKDRDRRHRRHRHRRDDDRSKSDAMRRRRPASPSKSPRSRPMASRPAEHDLAEDEAGRYCPVCWKWVRGDLQQHQQSNLTCKYWSRNPRGHSVSNQKREMPNRKPCPRCSKYVTDTQWSWWQHYLDVHPDHLADIDQDIPEEWKKQRRARLKSVKRESAESKSPSRRSGKRRRSKATSPTPDHSHTPLGSGPGKGPPGPDGGAGGVGGGPMGLITNLLIHIGQALASEAGNK